MALLIGDNFNYQGQKPNFERDSFDTIAAMKAYPETSLDDGHLSYCKEDGKRYEYKSSNSVDPTTGKWREFESGGGLESVPVATNDVVGGFKTGYTTSGKNYAVAIDGSSKAYVNVPWTDNNTTYSQATSETLGLVKIGYSNNSKNYGIQLDSSGKMFVNVPWTDNNTTYSKATTGSDGLMSKEDKTKLDGIENNANNYVLPAATNESLGGIKTGYTDNGTNYSVKVDENNKAYVTVDTLVTTKITASEYEALEEKDSNTIYYIIG